MSLTYYWLPEGRKENAYSCPQFRVQNSLHGKRYSLQNYAKVLFDILCTNHLELGIQIWIFQLESEIILVEWAGRQ